MRCVDEAMDLQAHFDRPFSEYLDHRKLSRTVKSFLLDAIALADSADEVCCVISSFLLPALFRPIGVGADSANGILRRVPFFLR